MSSNSYTCQVFLDAPVRLGGNVASKKGIAGDGVVGYTGLRITDQKRAGPCGIDQYHTGQETYNENQ
jgi:hypothetical protein